MIIVGGEGCARGSTGRRALETTGEQKGVRGRSESQPGVAGAIMVITREHVHYGAAVSTREPRLGAARFRLGPLLSLAYFASPSAHETTNRASATRLQPGCGSMAIGRRRVAKRECS